MTLYFCIPTNINQAQDSQGASKLIAIATQEPALPETPPAPWIANTPDTLNPLKLIDLDQADGKQKFVALMADVPLYRITLELLIDKALLEARHDTARAKGVRMAFTPEEPPEPVGDPVGEKYAFAGILHFPMIASRTDAQLLELYLKLFGAACPEHNDSNAHIAAMLGGHPERLIQNYDGILWRGAGWVRLDRIVYDGERIDHDPEITFESYVARGRAAAEALAISDTQTLLSAWIQAERVQRELCRDIDNALRLSGIRKLPRWVRTDVFRILEREAMKQVFAQGLVPLFNEWPALRRTRTLSEPIEANAKGEVAPLIQQLLNQTLSADAQYAGVAEAFALQAERRWTDAKKLLEK